MFSPSAPARSELRSVSLVRIARYGPEVRRRMASLVGAGYWPPAIDVAVGRAGDREQGAEVVLLGSISEVLPLLLS